MCARYQSSTQGDLVERLVMVEQAYGACQEQRAHLHCTLVNLQQEAKKR
ncbi:MAG TPA: hypothetical protein VGN34_09890 [Ktedonobacteraceae bacterium]